MKYFVLVADGMADRPLPELEGKTPLEAAETANIDLLAQYSEIGQVVTIPAGFSPGSDIANLSILGYDPRRYYSGRGPLEAAGMGVSLNEGDIAFSCSFVTFRDKQKGYDFNTLSQSTFLEDPAAGKITTDEARELIDLLNNVLGSDQIQFYAGKGPRLLMVWAHGVLKVECSPPYRLGGKEISEALPRGSDKGLLKKLIQASVAILSGHSVNEERISRGERPANGIWFWGQGKDLELPSFVKKYGKRGAVISALDCINGLANKAGLSIIDLPEAAGRRIETDDEGSVGAALEALETNDLVYLHFKAPDEALAGHLAMKIEAIERFDKKIVGPLISELSKRDKVSQRDPWRILIMPDHLTLVSTRDHVEGPVPYLLCRGLDQNRGEQRFSETWAARSQKIRQEGHLLMDYFLRNEG